MTIFSIAEFQTSYHHSREINAVLTDGLHFGGTFILSIDLVNDVKALKLDPTKGLFVICGNLKLGLLHNIHGVCRKCLLNCGDGV